MILRSKIKWVALGGLILSILSLVVHLILAKYSTQNLVSYSTFTIISDDIGVSVGGTQVRFDSYGIFVQLFFNEIALMVFAFWVI